MRLYLSGPMTGLPDNNFPAFTAAADLLRSEGYEVEDPASKGIIDLWEWHDYLRYDLLKLLECNGLALLPGWEFSEGANLEIHVARKLKMPVKPVNDWLMTSALQLANI